MPDIGTRATEKELAALQKKLRKVYSEAAKDIQRKLDEHNAKFATKNAQKLAQKEAGKITQEEYDSWVKGQVFMGEQWEAKADEIARTMTNANKEAAKLVREGTLSTFATNMNYELYQLEKQLGVQTGFNLYNAKSVSRLLKDKPKMLPEWKINEKKDYKWNRQKVENFITQGIIQGEGIPEIAKRLTVGLSARNEDKMRMFARTANTGAQNAGRQEMMEEAEDDGIEVEKTWVATLDDRTRDAHQELDGQTVPVKEPFVYGTDEIMFPGDPNAEPYLTYNCRCTLKEHYKGVKPGQRRAYKWEKDKNGKEHRVSYVTDATTYKEWKAAKGMGFEEWKKARSPETALEVQAPAVHQIAQGKDITGTWERRKDEFDFEIKDVINAQGFDGVPQVVSQEEFDRAVEESGFIAQRSYSAPDQETLDLYRESLYNGDWYVDCSNGGAVHGQGMYCAANYEGNLTSDIKAEMASYSSLGESKFEKPLDRTEINNRRYEHAEKEGNRIISTGGTNQQAYAEYQRILNIPDEEYAEKYARDLLGSKGVSYVETFTLAPGARFVDEDYIREQFAELTEKEKTKYSDVGAYAVAKGYDAIRTTKSVNGDTVILNRTKCIFLGGKK